MTSHRILQLNAISTAACGAGMLAESVLWVVASAIVLLWFWADFAAVARFLVIAVALVVEVFATLQFRAAGRVSAAAPQMA